MNNGEPFSNGSFIFTFAEKVKVSFSFLFIPAIAWFIITTILLILPGPDIPDASFFDKIPQFDKIVHATLFGGITFLFSYPFIKNFRASKKLLIYISILSTLYGVLMEYVQKYIAIQRDFDYFDMLADFVGSTLSLYICILLKNHLAKRQANYKK